MTDNLEATALDMLKRDDLERYYIAKFISRISKGMNTIEAAGFVSAIINEPENTQLLRDKLNEALMLIKLRDNESINKQTDAIMSKAQLLVDRAQSYKMATKINSVKSAYKIVPVITKQNAILNFIDKVNSGSCFDLKGYDVFVSLLENTYKLKIIQVGFFHKFYQFEDQKLAEKVRQEIVDLKI